MDNKFAAKIAAMREGGRRLHAVRKQLQQFTKVGMSFAEIEAEAQRLIRATGDTPNFALVPGYRWATCIMKNDEMCHGIPSEDKVVAAGDLIKIDVGLLHQGYHLDTTISFFAGAATPEHQEFLNTAQKALEKAIAEAKPGHSVFDVSFAMQKIVERKGYGMVYQLTGHGISKELHEDPAIPCVSQRSDKRKLLYSGQTIAIEVMCTMGDPFLKVDKDGWTYRTEDHSWTAMIEETVLVTDGVPEVLTRG